MRWVEGWIDNAHYALDQLFIHLETSHSTYASCPVVLTGSSFPTNMNIQKRTTLSLHLARSKQHFPGVLNVLLDLDEEGNSLPAVE